MPIVLNDTTGITTPALDTETRIAPTDLGTGTPDATNFLRGDGSWAVVGGIPAGTVISFAANTAPTGYLKANGAAVSRTTYAALFAAIGTTFGAGDGSTTFLVPELRGEFIRGWDDGRGVDASRVFGSAQASQMQSHTHGGFTAFGGFQLDAGSSSSGTQALVTSTNAAGGTSNSSENRPRNVALLACIKF